MGFVFAGVYLWLARPSWLSIAGGTAIAAIGVWLRAVASGHVKKNAELATAGPYAYTRNPLYLGSLIMAAGFAAASRNLWIALGIVVFFLVIYLPVIKSEEKFLRGAFPEFSDYAKRVPRLFPRPAAGSGGRSQFSRSLYLQHREYNALIGSALMILALSLKLIFKSGLAGSHKSLW